MNGEHLKLAMKRRRINQAELANECLVSPSTISHYMKGKRGIYYETLVAICKALDVSADYLLGLSEEMGGAE